MEALLKGPGEIGTCARCSISAAAKSKKLMMFPSFPDQAKELGIEIDLNYRFLKRDE